MNRDPADDASCSARANPPHTWRDISVCLSVVPKDDYDHEP
jgi:hypothetical protein